MTEPTKAPETWQGKVKTQVYRIATGWYLEVVVPHPDNPEMPDQLMTIKCDNEWWATFLQSSVDELLTNAQGREYFLTHAPEFRYEG